MRSPSAGDAELALLHLAAIVESSDDAIVSKSLDGIIRSWNPAAERIFGYTAAEMIGESIFKLVPPELHPEEHEVLARIRAGERVAHYETTRVRKDGERITISLSVSPIRDASGELVGASAIKRDISQHRSLEGQLRQAQKMEALGQLAGGMAHDFNNILTIIDGFASFLAREIPSDSPGRGDLLGIQRASERAARLTQQLLAFSRRQATEPEIFDLSQLVHETVGMLRRLLGEHIRVEVHVAAAAAYVHADRGQLSQVLLNLAVNARDAMPEGGTLSVSTYVDGDAGRVVLSVRDTGHGMDARTRARVFEPFFTTKPRGQGTGLGLAVAYGIVDRAQGRFEVESEPGAGSVFRVSLPRAKAPGVARRAPLDADVRGTETVLVVDDEPAIVELAARTLASYGYTPVPANGPGAAMIAFAERSGRIDLLLTDVVMPVMNGRDLAEHLRRDNPRLAVLYMSGYTDHVLAHVPGPGHDPLVAKPFTPYHLAAAAREALDQRRRHASPGGAPPARTP